LAEKGQAGFEQLTNLLAAVSPLAGMQCNISHAKSVDKTNKIASSVTVQGNRAHHPIPSKRDRAQKTLFSSRRLRIRFPADDCELDFQQTTAN
jgi:hypothetical protein